MGLAIPGFVNPGYTQDSAHDTLWARSPQFRLNGSGDLTACLSGGTGSGSLASAAVSSVPAASTSPGFLGIAFRNVNTGKFALSGRKTSNGNGWEQVTFTGTQLAVLDQYATYTLDLIDAAHGGWGWVNLDSVSIPGVIVSNSPPTISDITNRTIGVGQSVGTIAFTVGDAETRVENSGSRASLATFVSRRKRVDYPEVSPWVGLPSTKHDYNLELTCEWGRRPVIPINRGGHAPLVCAWGMAQVRPVI